MQEEDLSKDAVVVPSVLEENISGMTVPEWSPTYDLEIRLPYNMHLENLSMGYQSSCGTTTVHSKIPSQDLGGL